MQVIVLTCSRCGGSIEEEDKRCGWCGGTLLFINRPDNLAMVAQERDTLIRDEAEVMAATAIETTISAMQASQDLFNDLYNRRPWWKFW